MKQIAQNYKTGELSVLDVPAPVCRPGGVLVQSLFSLISTGTEMMKVHEANLSMVGKARARPDQVRKVLDTVSQQGAMATYKKVMNKLDSYTPLGYSLCGVVVEVGRGAEEFHVGQVVACAGAEFALHAEVNWVPTNLCVPVPDGVEPHLAAFATVGAIAMQGDRQGNVQLGDIAVVIGLGLVGLGHQLDDRHGGVVALAGADLGDPGVAARALGERRRDLGEQLVYHALVRDHGQHVPPGVQVTALGEGDQPLGDRTEPAGLGLSGGDPAVLEQRSGQISQDVPLVSRAATQPVALGGRGHTDLSCSSTQGVAAATPSQFQYCSVST